MLSQLAASNSTAAALFETLFGIFYHQSPSAMIPPAADPSSVRAAHSVSGSAHDLAPLGGRSPLPRLFSGQGGGGRAGRPAAGPGAMRRQFGIDDSILQRRSGCVPFWHMSQAVPLHQVYWDAKSSIISAISPTIPTSPSKKREYYKRRSQRDIGDYLNQRRFMFFPNTGELTTQDFWGYWDYYNIFNMLNRFLPGQ